MIIEHNVTTGEIIEREATAKEIKQRELDLANLVKEQVETEAKAAARQVILDRLGLTADEAKLLLG